MLQMRSATRGIRNDRVDRIEFKEIDHLLRLNFRLLEVAIVSVERAAADLGARSDHFATVFEEHFHGVAIDLGENEILNTPC